jgi:hypothetical protein
MTLAEFAALLQKQAMQLDAAKLTEAGALAVHDEITIRIFERGKNSQDNQIGNYSTKKDGKRINYREFRIKKGRQVAYVDLRFTGDLQRDFATGLMPFGDKWVSGVKRPFNGDKIDWNEKRYGAVFEAGKREIELFEETTTKIIAAILTGL